MLVGLVAGSLSAQRPGTVTDLTVVGATDSALTVRWTEVASGTTVPATYSVRIGPAAGFAWWLLPDGPQVPGTAAVPIGQPVRLTIGKLLPSTPYSVQLVAYTGALGVATFGGLSNVVTAATVATPPKPPPPPPPVSSLVCGAQVPPPVGCGLRAPLWMLLLGASTAGTFGPWYVLDSLDRPLRVVRVTVKDTTP